MGHRQTESIDFNKSTARELDSNRKSQIESHIANVAGNLCTCLDDDDKVASIDLIYAVNHTMLDDDESLV